MGSAGSPLEELSQKLGPNRVNMKVHANEFEQGHDDTAAKDEPLQALDLMDEARRALRTYHHTTDMYAHIERDAAARHGYVAPVNGSLKDDLLQRVLSARTRFKSDAQMCLHACKPHEVVLKALVAALRMSVVWHDASCGEGVQYCLHDEATLRTGAVLVIVTTAAASPPRIIDCFRTILLRGESPVTTCLLVKEFLLRFSMVDLKDLAEHAKIDLKGIKKKDVLADALIKLRAQGNPAARP